MRKLLLAVAVTLGLASAAQAVCDHRTTTCLTNLDVSGTLTTTACTCTNATLTPLNANVTYGVTAATGTFRATGGAVVVSSATTSSAYLKLGGAFASLPTTGYVAGTLIVLTSDKALYISTETVSGAFSWIKVGSQ